MRQEGQSALSSKNTQSSRYYTMERSGRKTNALNAQREAVYVELKEGKKQPNLYVRRSSYQREY